ncbi:MAG: hypothetical protein ABSF08_12975, partial [Candidatus Cybelea sp.]
MVFAAGHRCCRLPREFVLSVVEQPLAVVTNWGAAAVPPLGITLLAIFAAGLIYWWVVQRARPVSLQLVAVAAAAALVAAWCAPLLFSSDVYAYAAYGEMARIGLNPYVLAPLNSSD